MAEPSSAAAATPTPPLLPSSSNSRDGRGSAPASKPASRGSRGSAASALPSPLFSTGMLHHTGVRMTHDNVAERLGMWGHGEPGLGRTMLCGTGCVRAAWRSWLCACWASTSCAARASSIQAGGLPRGAARTTGRMSLRTWRASCGTRRYLSLCPGKELQPSTVHIPKSGIPLGERPDPARRRAAGDQISAFLANHDQINEGVFQAWMQSKGVAFERKLAQQRR